jgi:hypothetical protein
MNYFSDEGHTQKTIKIMLYIFMRKGRRHGTTNSVSTQPGPIGKYTRGHK